MKPRIYTDTSVLGGCLDEEFAVASLRLVESFKAGRSTIVVSDLTLAELAQAPAAVAAVLSGIPVQYRQDVELTEEARDLAERYIEAGVVGESKRVDAQHIAIASLSRVDVLVSWNFKHIVNLQRIRGYNSVNLLLGHPILEIRSPLEVGQDEEA